MDTSSYIPAVGDIVKWHDQEHWIVIDIGNYDDADANSIQMNLARAYGRIHPGGARIIKMTERGEVASWSAGSGQLKFVSSMKYASFGEGF